MAGNYNKWLGIKFSKRGILISKEGKNQMAPNLSKNVPDRIFVLFFTALSFNGFIIVLMESGKARLIRKYLSFHLNNN